MEAQFVDRILKCSDCHGEFVFTAGEQLFFHDKQFKNDPKRCKPCKSRRSGLSAAANGTGIAAAGLSRTETRTECSDCGIETTVPFKPTQGRPVLCRQCFQLKTRAAAKPADVPAIIAAEPALRTSHELADAATHAQTVTALTVMSGNGNGAVLSPEAAVQAVSAMAAASSSSSIASPADLASILELEPVDNVGAAQVPASLVAQSEAAKAKFGGDLHKESAEA